MSKTKFVDAFVLAITVLVMSAVIRAANPFVGDWALTIPGGGAGWLGVEAQNGSLSASIMWGAGSVLPVDSVKLDGDTLVLTRHEGGRRGQVTQTITAKVEGDDLKLTTTRTRPNGAEAPKQEFTGHRQPSLPPAPDLSKVKFGEPIQLFNGRDLSGWRLTDPHAVSGWTVHDRILTNHPVQQPGQPHKNYGNLRTDREFDDFNITLETNLPKGGNSGVYLRGIYEVQVADTYGRRRDPHNMGAVYSRITPSESVEKPAGQWQTLDITFVECWL